MSGPSTADPPSICVLIPYFGQWPEWIDLYLNSCAGNPTVNWCLISDCAPRAVPANVRFVTMSWAECAAKVSYTCELKAPLTRPYKLCDFRFAFGHVFQEFLTGYDFWGFGDIDVMYGDLRHFLSPAVMDHDLITFNRTHVSGHFTLLRNTREVVLKYRTCEKWRAGAEEEESRFLDENNGYYGIEKVYAEESHNTPLSPYIPWTSGNFVFPAIWHYRNGRLFTNLDGTRHFLYLHFMRYKYQWNAQGLKEIVHLSPAAAQEGWDLLLDGFHPIGTAREIPAGIPIVPASQ